MSDYFLGEIRLFPFGVVPQGWLACNGQTLQVRQNAALAALLGNQFGGDGVNTFSVPDLRGRAVVSQGTVTPTDVYKVGQKGGQEGVSLTESSMPSHNHAFVCAATSPATINNPNGAMLAQATAGSLLYASDLSALVPLMPASIATQGSGASHENRQPSLALNFCISTAGIWPQRD
jgi:microcystin-dependent protein